MVPSLNVRMELGFSSYRIKSEFRFVFVGISQAGDIAAHMRDVRQDVRHEEEVCVARQELQAG